jgi:hypothetical protein
MMIYWKCKTVFFNMESLVKCQEKFINTKESNKNP